MGGRGGGGAGGGGETTQPLKDYLEVIDVSGDEFEIKKATRGQYQKIDHDRKKQ